ASDVYKRQSSTCWVPVADAALRHDLFKNLIRNAVEATEERACRAGAREVTVDEVPVTVHLSSPGIAPAGSPRPGVRVEIEDSGIGMDPEDEDKIWESGYSRHAKGRGHGLTESKKEFLASRGSVCIWSAAGVGTLFRIHLTRTPIPIPDPPLWSMRPMVAAIAVVLLAAGLALASVSRPTATTVEVRGGTRVVGMNDEGKVLWSWELGEEILTNHLPDYPSTQRRRSPDRIFPITDRDRLSPRLALATQPIRGPSKLWIADRRGRVIESHHLRWIYPERGPLASRTGSPSCRWLGEVLWGEKRETVLITHARVVDYYPTATQFFRASGDSLGCYYHCGHLTWRASEDFDGDGAQEVLMYGINNEVARDTTIFPEDPQTYVDCLVMLEPPSISGQSYPYHCWAGLPRAGEKGYLILPPLRRGTRPEIRRIDIGQPSSDGAVVQVTLFDGRMYWLDATLRPLFVRTGDFSDAARSAPVEPYGPLVHFSKGERTDIRMMVK
ncbi:MAG: ATP-binding protein, partial [Candidatus Eisenbacteria bacterium]|nr:ATP-binding protein [Candidatus Eisenbacteria bacterium]